ncbi:MAG: response regulator [Bacteroidia bacterium]
MKHKVLVVEDYAPMRQILKDILADYFDLLVAEDGDAALQICEQDQPDLIISDIMMPKRNGLSLLDALKSNPQTKDIPLIFITALTDIEDKHKGLELGAVDYISKPFDIKEVIMKAKNILKDRQSLQSKSELNKMFEENKISVDDRNAEFIRKTKAYISDNLSNSELSVKMISEHLTTSLSTFERYFEKHFHETPKVYIRTQRLEKAYLLFKNNYTSVADVAFSVGFNSLSYFCKCFKDQYKVSPSSVIKKQKK